MSIFTEEETKDIIVRYLQAPGTATEGELEAAVQRAEERTITNARFALAMEGRTRLGRNALGEVLSGLNKEQA